MGHSERLAYMLYFRLWKVCGAFLLVCLCMATLADSLRGEEASTTWSKLQPYFTPPAQYAEQYSELGDPLKFADGSRVKTAEDWTRRRAEILKIWTDLMGEWPAVIEHPKVDILESTHRENFTQKHVVLEIAPRQSGKAYLLVPDGPGPFPAMVAPYYEPETSVGLGKQPLRDFAYQLTRRGFVTLSLGSPDGDARKPLLDGQTRCQPLSYLGYVAANAWQALASMPEVDAKRIGIVGHSYGGKWAMFGACLWNKYACGVWSDPGVQFDEARANVNYWEPWYLGADANVKHRPGLITPDNPRTGAYRALVQGHHDLPELQALMAPRPMLVSGGSEDTPERWKALNHLRAVNHLLGYEDRVGMTNRKAHPPTEESNAVIYAFFEYWLKERS